jgi:hypothetical protein
VAKCGCGGARVRVSLSGGASEVDGDCEGRSERRLGKRGWGAGNAADNGHGWELWSTDAG